MLAQAVIKNQNVLIPTQVPTLIQVAPTEVIQQLAIQTVLHRVAEVALRELERQELAPQAVEAQAVEAQVVDLQVADLQVAALNKLVLV